MVFLHSEQSYLVPPPACIFVTARDLSSSTFNATIGRNVLLERPAGEVPMKMRLRVRDVRILFCTKRSALYCALTDDAISK